MNLYACKFVETETFGAEDFCGVVLHIAAETRGKAKAILISSASGAGFEVEWTDPTSITLLAKNVDLREGEDFKFSWALKNIPGFYVKNVCPTCDGLTVIPRGSEYPDCPTCGGEGYVYTEGDAKVE